jgi:hypothetical protein
LSLNGQIGPVKRFGPPCKEFHEFVGIGPKRRGGQAWGVTHNRPRVNPGFW